MQNETNKILNELEQGTEMGVIQRKKILDSIDGLEPALEGVLVKTQEANEKLGQIVENTKKEEVQRVKLEPGEQDDMAVQFFSMLKGKPGETPSDERLTELIKPLIPVVEDGKTPTTGELLDLIIPLIPEPEKGEDGKDGKDYILTDQDKDEIVSKIEVPIVEKVIEKTEIIKEVAMKDTAEDIIKKVDKLDETFDYSKLKNKPNLKQLEEKIQTVYNKQSSKTVSLAELDDVNLTGLTKTDGKYDLGSGGGGGGTWGSITGTLSNQTDLQTALDAKVPYTGATANVDLGTYDLITDTITAKSSAGLTLENSAGGDVLHLGNGGGVNATAYGGWNFDGATANTIAIFGASKTLSSASTATYPSLTELAYVKGVTSSIQTQLNAKQNTLKYYAESSTTPSVSPIATGISAVAIGDSAEALGNYTHSIGNGAGYNATNAFNSNFIGSSAGVEATNASISNFIGNGAGSEAINAEYSNFIGYIAGANATNAFNSNFIGSSAGVEATNASNSNFIGNGAGYQATNAESSHFMGVSSGYQATNASGSVFIGYSSGESATNASFSTFIGGVAGSNATDASFSTFIGNGAGQDAVTANNSIFIGIAAGNGDTVNNSSGGTSILIGDSTSTGGFSNSVAIGNTATNTAVNQFMIGSPTKPLNVKTNGVVTLTGYTVATLPTGTLGSTAYVTNALAPTIGSVVVGGGLIKAMVWFNGTSWTVTGL